MSRPLVVDIDGTMSRPDRSIEGRVIDALHEWARPVVIATGKAFPYPVALCDFIGIPIRVIAENGGVVCTEETVEIQGDREVLRAFERDLESAGFEPGWASADLVNRWRETEIATTRDIPRETVTEIAARHGLEVVDSQYAYHIKSPDVNKGEALVVIASLLGIEPTEFVAIGDSENDISTFEVAGLSYAVANAEPPIQAAADHITTKSYADGLLEVLESVN